MSAFDPVRLSERYLDALLGGDRREAVSLLLDQGLSQGASVSELLVDVVQRAQREIGRLWQENRISVADEHLATAISQLAMARLFQMAPDVPPNGRALTLACVEGEHHDMGIRVASDILDLDGFRTHCLGANVPLDSLLARLAQERPDAVCLSVTMTFNLPMMRASVARIHEHFGAALPILVGGHAFEWSPDADAGLPVAGRSTDAVTMVSDVRRVLGL